MDPNSRTAAQKVAGGAVARTLHHMLWQLHGLHLDVPAQTGLGAMMSSKRPFMAAMHELGEQVAALRASCAGYDSGLQWEAKRIATILYVLLHDGTRNAHSVLSQLGMRGKGKFFSSLHPDPALAPGRMPLIALRINSERAICVAPLEEALNFGWARFLSFDDWWDETLYVSRSGKRLTREGLVRAIRDQDGGGHFDPALSNEAYAELRQFDFARAALEYSPTALDGFDPERREALKKGSPHAHRAAVRQIAWEFLHSCGNQPPRNQ